MLGRSTLLSCMALCALACAGCGKPQSGTPGLDPPSGRGPGAIKGAAGGSAQSSGNDMNAKAGTGGSHSSVTGSPTTGEMGGSAGATASTAGNAPPSTMTTLDASASSNPSTPGLDEDGGIDNALADPWFVGFWVVNQPAHALSEATLYELVAGGTLAEHETYTMSAEPAGFVTGTVSNASGVQCAIKSSWASESARVLRVGSSCSDGTPRPIVLAFPPGDASVGMTPTIESVAGESGWSHDGATWSWRKCPSRTNCSPF